LILDLVPTEHAVATDRLSLPGSFDDVHFDLRLVPRLETLMSLDLHRLADATPFDPPGHRGVGPVRLVGPESGSAMTVALSHYLPGGEAEKSAVEQDSVYLLLEGELVVVTDDGETVLGRLDAVHLGAGTVRAVQNRTTLPASMLVIRPNPTITG
jgi:quercetin dioxygenase-like cupin family protein